MTPFRILVAGRAKRELARATDWWRTNRLDAPALFLDELTTAFELIARAPHSGGIIENPVGVRRWLLPRSRFHIYYTTDDRARTVMVRALWHATRGSGPKLR